MAVGCRQLPPCLWLGWAGGHFVPPSAEAWLGPWPLLVCSELAGSCGRRGWTGLGSSTGHFTHFSSSQNYCPVFFPLVCEKEICVPAAWERKGRVCFGKDHSVQPAAVFPPSDLFFQKHWPFSRSGKNCQEKLRNALC